LLHKRAKPIHPPYLLPLPTYPPIPKGKIALSFASPEKENYFLNICDVITSPEKEKISVNHYSHSSLTHHPPTRQTPFRVALKGV
jgi:hypothetical protein